MESERIAQALESMFRCSECKNWKPVADIGRDIPWDAERVAGYLCWLCERDLWLLAEAWPGREVA
jgi:hypothetical protein